MLKDQRVIVTGGSRGLGLGMTEALVERGARVTIVARDTDQLAEAQRRLGVAVIAGDVTDVGLAARVVRDVRPDVLVLNAGATPAMAPIDEMRWEDFTGVWENDVKAGLYWIQAALRLPMPRGSRVVVSSSGAAIAGSPLSGGYGGAKRMLWLMASYANTVSIARDLGIRFQVLVPRQMIGDTRLGRSSAEAYASRKGISVEAFLAGFGAPMSPRQVGEHLVTLLSDAAYDTGVAFGVKGDLGLHTLDA